MMGAMALWDYLEKRERETLAKLEELERQRLPLLADLEETRVAKKALRPNEMPLFRQVGASSDLSVQFYKGLTLKALVLRALAEHFVEGATAHELLEYFETAYARSVARESLSPQLSRLKDEQKIVLDGKHWRLINHPDAGKGADAVVTHADGTSYAIEAKYALPKHQE
jgi:hypothetical protein